MPQSTVKSITARQKHIFSLSTPPTINVIEVQAFSFKGHYKKCIRNYTHFYRQSPIFSGSEIIGQLTDKQF